MEIIIKYAVELSDGEGYFGVVDSDNCLGFLLEFSAGEFYEGRFDTLSGDSLNYNLGVL